MEHFDETLGPQNAFEDAVQAMADHARFDKNEALRMYREFYAECPHHEAAVSFMQDFLVRHMQEERAKGKGYPHDK